MRIPLLATGALALALAAACTSGPSSSSSVVTGTAPGAGLVTRISGSCPSALRVGNAEVELASDPARGLIYAEWIGCGGIGFARSADGGATWSSPSALPPTRGKFTWDPSIAVGPSGTVYAAFMARSGPAYYPVVDSSTDHGATWQVHKVPPPNRGDFGDRDFVAVSRTGEIYLTWDYAPRISVVREHCFAGGSCAYSAGDFNIVIQRSTDGGRTWTNPVPVAPGYPASGSISAPVVVMQSGRIDVLFERYAIVNRGNLTLGPGHNYFTSSGDDGRTWSAPVMLGPASSVLSLRDWWIDGSLSADAAGNLYATWDSQSGGHDVGWLSYSVNGGRTWSTPLAVTSGSGKATNIVQVLGGGPGKAYVGLLTDGAGRYAQYLRAFSIAGGWGTAPIQVSRLSGRASIWPGDTIGLALARGGSGHSKVAVSWGSALTGERRSSIWAAVVHGLP